MRTDFREERRWKMALAFNVAHAVREWYLADTEDRKLLCVGATPALHSIEPEASDVEVDMPLDSEEAFPLKTSKVQPVDLPDVEEIVGPDVSWEQSEEIDPEREVELIQTHQREQRKGESIEPQNQKEEDLDADGEDDADGEMDVDDGNEGVETQETPVALDAMQVDEVESKSNEAPTDNKAETKQAEEPLPADFGLKDGAGDVILAAEPAKLPGTSSQSNPFDEVKTQIRATISLLPEASTFVDLNDLCFDLSKLSTLEPFTPPALPELFPELSAFQPLYATPEQTESIVVPKGEKKSEKKDKKALEELSRTDEASSFKLIPASTFMQYKPLLVSALEPAKHWRDNEWIDLDNVAVTGDDVLPTLETPADSVFRVLFWRYTLIT